MVDGPGGYTVTGTSTEGGITVAPASRQFGSDGSASGDVTIKVAPLVPEAYYPVYLTTTVDQTIRRSVVFVIVRAEPD
jgi:hypothetical protein